MGERVMEAKHREAFFQAADQLQCWIGVREPNPLAGRWMGAPRCAPKPQSCQAKTADNPTHPLAGLVVNPNVREEAFQNLIDAKAIWNSWIGKNRKQMPFGYSETSDGREAGLVRLSGNALYSDFDLMAIVRSNEQGEFLVTSTAEQREAYVKVRRSVNKTLGIPMVQHGPEMDYTKGVGAKPFERVLWFGPGHRVAVHPSYMKNDEDKNNLH